MKPDVHPAVQCAMPTRRKQGGQLRWSKQLLLNWLLLRTLVQLLCCTRQLRQRLPPCQQVLVHR